MYSNKLITTNFSYPIQSTALFERFLNLPYAIFLDSCSDLRNESGIDVIAASPFLRFISKDNQYQIYNKDNDLIESGDNALNKLKELEKKQTGSLLGYLGYHSNDEFFKLINKKTDIDFYKDTELPDICIGFYAWRIEIDHINKTSILKYQENKCSTDDLTLIQESISASLKENKKINSNVQTIKNYAQSNFTKADYIKSFQMIQSYISKGDCYQVNLAQRFTLDFKESSWQHYKFLRSSSPAPYACYFTTPFGDILSFSPESFLKISQSGKIVSQPIKGTRKRHVDMYLDQDAAQELANSEKDRAENLMIVDLIRNDLSKSAELNSVNVDTLFEIKSFANVHHMVSQVSAQKAKNKSNLDVLLNCFPGGSITGAPKKRAMQIIKELEPHRRQVYCGAIGQINFEGEMEFNIAIRTIIIKNEALYCWGGGGLVADSIAEAEYQESITKINNLIPIADNNI
jgi:para-aminobenzoate synthetase component 1